MTELLTSYKVPMAPLEGKGYSVNTEAGLIIPTDALPLNKSAIAAAFAKYSALYMGAKRYLVPGFTNGLPRELQQSFKSWVDVNGLDALLPALHLLVRPCCSMPWLQPRAVCQSM